MEKFDTKNCNALTEPYYTILGAAICLCDLKEQEMEITDKVLNKDYLCEPFSWWPHLEKTIDFLNTAIQHKDLPYQEHHAFKSNPQYYRTVKSSDLKTLLNPSQKIKLRSETTFLMIIGAMLYLLLKTFKKQELIISEIEKNFPNINNLSKRTLEGKFADANKVMQEIKKEPIVN